MQREYITIGRKNSVRKNLQKLSLAPIMEKKSCIASEAFEELREVINAVAHHGPWTHRSEDHKVEYLHEATIDAEWTWNALTQCYTNFSP